MVEKIDAVLFGATGMIGSGVLIECLEHPEVRSVLVIGRKSCGVKHQKLTEVIHQNFLDYSAIEQKLSGYSACFFCLGISSNGMSEEEYHTITHDYAVKAGEVLVKHNPGMTFCFISGMGADDTLKSRLMWARVKGKAENSLKSLPFKRVYVMRPGFVQPEKGIVSPHVLYRLFRPFYPVVKFLFPKLVSTTSEVGMAMINAVRYDTGKQTLENEDIIKLGRESIRT